MIYQQILDMEDKPNQKIVGIATSMSDIAVCVADVKQFATIDQLINVGKKANDLIGRTVEFFNKHKKRGSLGKHSLIDSDRCFTYRKTEISKGILCFSGKGAGRTRNAPDRL